MNEYEKPFWEKNELVLGIDEVGRGPICGPLVIAGVILPINYFNEDIKDSKKLSFKKIEKLYNLINEVSIKVVYKVVEPSIIDKLNIYQATKKYMEEIVNEVKCQNALIDAMPLNTDYNTTSIIKGDSKSISIAAASIVAKYIRDDIMIKYDSIYPEYGFKNHKGYPTKKHLEAIKLYGLKNFYRMTYGPCKKINEITLF